MDYHNACIIAGIILINVAYWFAIGRIQDTVDELKETRRTNELTIAQLKQDNERQINVMIILLSHYLIGLAKTRRVIDLDQRNINDLADIIMRRLGYDRNKRNRVLRSCLNNGGYFRTCFKGYLTQAYSGRVFTVDYLQTQLHPPPCTESLPVEFLETLVLVLNNVRNSKK